MDSVKDVLIKTQDIPNKSFDGVLKYKGINVMLNVVGKVEQKGIKTTIYKETDGCEIFDEDDEFTAHSGYFNDKTINPNKYDSWQDYISDKVSIENPVDDITKANSRKEQNGDEIIAFQYANKVYIVVPLYRFVYSIQPDNANAEYQCVESKLYNSVPDSVPKTRISGHFNMKKDIIEFEYKGFLNILFSYNTLQLDLEFTDSVSYYDRYELIEYNENPNPNPKQNTSEEYNAANLSLHKNHFIISTSFNDESITFSISLTAMGRLPERATERLDERRMISVLDSENTLIARIKANEDCSKWSSNNGKYELVDLE